MREELETKHMLEKNKLARTSGIIASALTIIFALVSILDQGPQFIHIVRLVLGIVGLVCMQLLFMKIGDKYKYKYVVTLSMALLFIIMIFQPANAHVYPFMYIIIVIVLIYGEASTVSIGSAIAIIGLTVSDIIEMTRGNITYKDMTVQLLLAVFACIIAYLYCNMLRSQRKENADEIKSGAAKQAKTARSIIGLAKELGDKFTEAKSVSDELNNSMGSTHNSVMDIVEGTKTTAVAVEAQTNKTSEIHDSINAVGEEANAIDEVSGRVEETVNEGVELINQLKSQAEKVASINLETSSTTQALNESIQDVQAITETILGISSQTNLLALNASIEAARAGEAGKGFAVVADEIRALSESTREATEKISQIIERLTNDAKQASSAMEKSAEYANKQNELIVETGTKLDSIKAGTDELREGVITVKGSVQSVIDANQQIMDSIANLSATSQEVAASTDTVLSLSDAAMSALGGMNETLGVIHGIAEDMEEVASNKE
ncbi:MAG: hypothetical protein K5773_09460 [Pseudobutyrivibrio sp.]|nr:hypothetical protein [Pseudobutyrivibrio sp.]